MSHCSGKGNPVIDASRGLNPQKLSNHHSGGEDPISFGKRKIVGQVQDVPDSDPELRVSASTCQCKNTS